PKPPAGLGPRVGRGDELMRNGFRPDHNPGRRETSDQTAERISRTTSPIGSADATSRTSSLRGLSRWVTSAANRPPPSADPTGSPLTLTAAGPGIDSHTTQTR